MKNKIKASVLALSFAAISFGIATMPAMSAMAAAKDPHTHGSGGSTTCYNTLSKACG